MNGYPAAAPFFASSTDWRIGPESAQVAISFFPADVTMRIVLCYPVESHHLAQIATAAPEAELVDAGQERIADEIFSADVYCGHAKVPVDWEGVVRQGRLQWIQSSAAGMDHCLVPSVVESSITVTSASGVLSDQVAEHAIALLTGWCRSLPVFFRAQQKKEFIRRPTRDLTRSTVGIVGFGGVGRRLAELLGAFPCADPRDRHVPGQEARLRRGPLAGRSARRPVGRGRLRRAVAAAERHDLGHGRREGLGPDEARRRAGQHRPGARWWSRPIWSRHWRPGGWPGR